MSKRGLKKSITKMLIVAMLVILLLPMSASADSRDRIKVLKPGKWATVSEKLGKEKEADGYEYEYYYDLYYKITVKKSGRIAFTLSKDAYIELLTGPDRSSLKYLTRYINSSDSSKMVAVNKGTYYLYVREGKCKYTFKASAAPKNYCIAKAQKLKANKKIYNVLTPKTSFDRWFKITNPKKKKIVFWSNKPERIIILNSKYRNMSTIAYGSDTRYCTEKALPKGTYYICVRGEAYESWDDERDYGGFGDVITLKWK